MPRERNPTNGAATLAGIVLVVVTIGVVVVLPIVLGTVAQKSGGEPSEAPMVISNEVSPPAGALAIGLTGTDRFTQRVCPPVGPPLAGRATNERFLSNTVFSQPGSLSIPDPRGLNSFAWAFGQFIDHDIILSLEDETLLGNSIEMLPHEGIYLDLKRVQRRNGPLGIETVNQLSAHIDASTVYGDYKNQEKLATLREKRGQLSLCKMQTGPGGTPKYVDGDFQCGDVRCAEHPLLSSLHALFLREHNRWCTQLGTSPYTSAWTEEQRFWKARSLTIAVIQHITYEEWLPALFGSQKHLLYSTPLKGEYTRITTEFGAAAYRFGHSMVSNKLGELPLVTLFFDPAQTISLGVDSILKRGLQTYSQTVDNKVVDGLRNFLFSADHVTVSEDLVARNIYRGREIELCSYQDMCRCYGTPIQGYPPNGNTDPIVGLLGEPLVEGSSLPRTLAVVLAEQFRRLKLHDENYHTKVAHSQLSADELYLVTRSTFKDVLLRNTALKDTDIPKNAFFK